ncbi:MAG: hypothetical protein ACI8RZ_003753 [Myxococcota bacterium]|jgi:hypothetical protein
MTMGLLSLLMGCQGCRVTSPEDSALTSADAAYDLGEVWLGGEVARRLPIDAAEITGDAELSLTAGIGYVDVRWVPADLGEAALILDADGATITLTASVVEPGLWPRPLATPITLEPLDSLPDNQLGDALFPATGPIPFAADPVNGDVWFGAADQGRAWRLDVFYNHSSWGLWVFKDIEQKGTWDAYPGCFLDTSGLLQDGTCTGAERNTDNSIPGNWRYLHGGFVGEYPEAPLDALPGLSAMVTDELADRIWLLGDDNGTGWMRAIDTGLAPGDGEGDGDDAYTFRQLVPAINFDLGDGWGGLRGGLFGTGLWIASTESGQTATLTPDGIATPLATVDGLVEVVQLGDTLVALTDTEIQGISLSEGTVTFSEPRPVGLTGAPVSTWAEQEAAWMVFEDQMLMIRPTGEIAVVLPPEGVSLVGAVTDVVGGGTGKMALQYVAGVSATGGVLWGASPDGVWYDEPIILPASPRAIGHARDSHDIFILYAAGSEGCDNPALGIHCQDGERPPVVHAFYNPYSLVPPTAAGHKLNLFISPILETPKDNGLGGDFAQGPCSVSETYDDISCCALSWVTEQRLAPNVDYFIDTIQSLGDETKNPDDDPTIAWGINPTLLRQAVECMESDNPQDRLAGIDLYTAVLDLPAPRSSIANWTHTAGGEDLLSDPQDWFVYQAPDSTGYTAPVSDQYEYSLLHHGMSVVFDPTRLPEGAGDLLKYPADALWTPLISGNSLDAAGLATFKNWADPDWLTPIRDAPLSIGQPPRSAYYFLAAGVELEIEMTKFRKKELYPFDIRQRSVHWLSTDIQAPGVSDSASGVINIPGMSWEIGTLGVLSEAGAFRETLRFAVQVEEKDWEYAHRYVRRVLSASQPDDIKSWYIHIFDITNPNGLFTINSGVTEENDITRDAIQRLNDELVGPGYARWALPEEILVEWDDAQ